MTWSENFLAWPSPHPTMTGTRKKLPAKQPLQRKRTRATTNERGGLRLRPANEARSKFRNDDWRVQSRADEKGKAVAGSSLPYKRRKHSGRQAMEDEPQFTEPASYETSTEMYSASSVRR